jgi:hypothetical protein
LNYWKQLHRELRNMTNNNVTKPKRKRGRRRKKPKEVPTFKNDSEIREYIIQQSLLLSMELIEIATKKNNIKKPAVVRAETNQYKSALEGLRVVNSLVKDKQLDEIQTKLRLMEEGLTATLLTEARTEEETSDNISKAVEELTKINEELATLKGSD